MAGNEAEEYHLASSIDPSRKHIFAPPELDEGERMAAYLSEGRVDVSEHGCVKLEIDGVECDMRLDTAILTRRSGRSWSTVPLAKSVLGSVLHLANGVRRKESALLPPGCDRNAPSAGALGSVELFCCVLNVEGVQPGLYYFDNTGHRLLLVKEGQFATWLSACVMLQEDFCRSGVIIFLVSAQKRLASKYGIRAYRLGLLDAGHVSQNIYLASTAYGLQACAVGGFVDSEVNNALGIDGISHCAVLALAVGNV
ncbi:MAG TPA: SagB/ThcOx family dehydrogenase [Candidatus Obscuribacterales bacterium]